MARPTKSVIAHPGKDFRIHPRSEAEALVIRTLELITRQPGMHHARHLRDGLVASPFGRVRAMTVDQTKGSTA